MSKTLLKSIFNVNEYCSWILSQSSPHNCIIAAAVEGGIILSRFKEALEIASREQPMFGFSIARNNPAFVTTNQPVQVKLINSKEDWRKIAENELATKFLDGEVLARITLVNHFDIQYIIFCFHHVIGDGVSGTHFLSRLINIYNNSKLLISINETQINIPVPKESLSVSEERFENRFSTKIKGISIDSKKIAFLENKIKKLDIPLNAYLYAKILESAFYAFGVSCFNVSMPVDLRERTMKASFSQLKFLTSWIDFEINNQGNDLVEIMQEKIKQGFRLKQHLYNLISLSNKIDLRASNVCFTKSFVSNKPTICISNLSFVDDKVFYDQIEGELKLVELHLSGNAQSYMGTSDSFTVQLCRLKNRGQFLNVNYPSPLVLHEKIDMFLECFQNSLAS